MLKITLPHPPPTLVRIASDHNLSQLLRIQTPGGKGIWDGIQFTVSAVPECDYLVMLNNRRLDPLTVHCPPENVWAIMQEPYEPGLYDWLIEGHEPYARVYSHYPPNEAAPAGPTMLPEASPVPFQRPEVSSWASMDNFRAT